MMMGEGRISPRGAKGPASQAVVSVVFPVASVHSPPPYRQVSVLLTCSSPSSRGLMPKGALVVMQDSWVDGAGKQRRGCSLVNHSDIENSEQR